MTTVELTAAEAAGADLPTAGPVRLVLTGDELVGHGADRVVRVRTGDVRSVVWLDQPRTQSLLRRGNGPLARFRDLLGLVVVLGDDGPLLACYVHDLAALVSGDGLAHLRSSGVEELAAALGVPVEGAGRTSLDRAAVSAVLVGHRTWHPRTALATPLVVLAGVSGFAAGPGAEEWWGPAGLVVSVVLAALVLSWLLGAQRRLQSALSRAPDLEDRIRFPHADPTSPLASQLQLGGRTVLVWAGWRLSRRRGPLRRGGITRCVVGPELVALLDDRGGAQLVLERSELLPDEQALAELTGACTEAGIQVERRDDQEGSGAAATLLRVSWTFDRAARPDAGLHPVETGSVSLLAPGLLALALLAQALGGTALAAAGSEVGSVVGRAGLVATALLALGLLWTHLSFRRLRARTTRLNPRRVPAPRLDRWRSRVGGPGGGDLVLKPTPQERP